MRRNVLTCVTIIFLFSINVCSGQQSSGMSSMPMMPVMAASNEATKDQLTFAGAEGDSVDKCTDWLLQQKGVVSGQTNAGEYKITYVFSRPEGWYELSNDVLTWREPSSNADAHLWLFVQDAADHRIVPPLSIKYTLKNAQGNVSDENEIAYAWMPLVNGYGTNVKLSGNGNYTLRLDIAPMPYRRHDPYNGDRFTHNTTAVINVSVDKSQFSKQPLSELMEAHQKLAENAGKAFHNTLEEMYKQANDGGDTTIGDYTIAFAVEYAEGYWHYENSKFRYMQENDMSGKTNAHVEVAALDAKSGRFLDNLDVTATLKSEDGKQSAQEMKCLCGIHGYIITAKIGAYRKAELI
ncbi:MAG TPA: iron transporter [Parafilimonas sp.]|nr:iron transporter [Parafilimonas sp.]